MKAKEALFRKIIIVPVIAMIVLCSSCSKKSSGEQGPSDIWDIDNDGIPKFVDTNYIELSKIYRISKFRSSVGHDYSDFTEQCRSMKHYFEPLATVDWSTVKIYCPVKGVITRVEEEGNGTKVEIMSTEYPAFRFQIFHINLATSLTVSEQVQAGEYLGTHIGLSTYSDISVIVNDPTKQGRMVSFFEVITDKVFSVYQSRGITARTDLIISKDLRDANPLTCSGDTFTSGDVLESWVTLDMNKN
jgi:hypothetical protein